MMNREMQKYQEEMLLENYFAQEMLKAKKYDEYLKYIEVSNVRLKSGMTAEEIDAVMKRAEEAAKKFA